MTLSSSLSSDNFQNPAGALLWQLESGVDMPLSDVLVKVTVNPIQMPGFQGNPPHNSAPRSNAPHPSPLPVNGERELGRSPLPPAPSPAIIATPEAKQEAVRLASEARTLDDLRAAIQNFDGIQIKRHATHMVFSDGTPTARVMVVGDAPGTEDDQQGRPFCGEDGALLDKMFASIGLSRYVTKELSSRTPPSNSPRSGGELEGDPGPSSELRPDEGPGSPSPLQGEDVRDNNLLDPLYITTILNWRPPGNRTPTPAEFDISMPLIERHIALVRPDILVCVGGEAAKLLFGTTDGITKIHGVWRDYRPLSLPDEMGFKTRAIAIYHPSFLTRTPAKKREAWADLQKIQAAVAALPSVE